MQVVPQKSIEIHFGETRIRYVPRSELATLGLPKGKLAALERVMAVLEVYRAARYDMVQNKYRHIAASLPEYFHKKAAISVLCCRDGIVVRQEMLDIDDVVGAWNDGELRELVPIVSERYVHIRENGEPPPAPDDGPRVQLFTEAPDGTRKDWLATGPVIIAKGNGDSTVQRPGRPLQTATANPFWEISLIGVELPKGGKRENGTTFVTRTPVRLDLHFERFDVYGPFKTREWQQTAAAHWAEGDILLEAATRNAMQEKFLTLDPRWSARQHFVELVKKYDQLMNDAGREEDFQNFLTEHPSFLEPAHKRVWPKLAIGNRDTDFVVQLATGEYVLIELEHSTRRLFTKGGQQTAELTHAIDQIVNWRRYIEDNLATVQHELGLKGITPNPKSMVVIGRSSSLTAQDRRKLSTLAGQTPQLRIMTYDDLRTQTLQALENMVGPIREQQGETQIYYPKLPVDQVPRLM